MKLEVFSVLLFAAVTLSQLDAKGPAVEEGQEEMCPEEFFKKYPEIMPWPDKESINTYLPDFTELLECTSTGVCDNGFKCCNTPCGKRCLMPFSENDFEFASGDDEGDTSELIKGLESDLEDTTGSDTKRGMCPLEYLVEHPKFKNKLREKFLEYSQKEDFSIKFPNFTKLADCADDGDCIDTMRCCISPCGMKCMTSVFSDKDFENIILEHLKNNRMKREIDEHSEGSEQRQQGSGLEHGKGHGKGAEHGKGHGKGAEHGKGHGKGAEHGKGHGKGAEHGKGHGKGAEHGKGHGKGAEHGKGHGKGAEHGKGHGKGAEHGKGHGKGAEHGKGHGKGAEHGKGHGKGAEHGKGHGKGAEHGKGHGKGAEHGKGHGKGQEHGN
ncbi:uncharacterized protein O3C94_017342 [Discoglossus pictus]